MKIPEGYPAVFPYLILKGAEEFIEFTIRVFNAEENKKARVLRDDKAIMHGEIHISGVPIMFAESSKTFPPCTTGLFIYVENADETYQKAIDLGATSLMGLSDQDYGRTCGITDPFGNIWWITSMPG